MLTRGSGEQQEAGYKASTNQYSFLSAAPSLYSAINTNSAGVRRLYSIWYVKAQTCCFRGIPSVLHHSDWKLTLPSLHLAAGWGCSCKARFALEGTGKQSPSRLQADGKLHLSSVRRTVNGLLPLSLPQRWVCEVAGCNNQVRSIFIWGEFALWWQALVLRKSSSSEPCLLQLIASMLKQHIRVLLPWRHSQLLGWSFSRWGELLLGPDSLSCARPLWGAGVAEANWGNAGMLQQLKVGNKATESFLWTSLKKKQRNKGKSTPIKTGWENWECSAWRRLQKDPRTPTRV